MNKIIFSIILLSSFTAKAELVDKVLAIVSDEVITLSDLQDFRKQVRADKFEDELFTINKKEVLSSDRKALEHLIEQQIIKSEIKRQNLEVTKEAVEQEINKVQRRNRISRAQLREALKQQGTNFADYFQFVKERMERQAVIQQAITSKIRISDEDINAYYLENYGNAKKNAFQYTLAHILFLPQKPNAMARAKDVYQKIQNGQPFEEMAAQYSEDPNFTAGGTLGKFKSGEFMKELDAAVAKLSAGDISAPIKTPMGIHIIKVNEKRLIPNPQYEAKKDEIRQILSSRALKEQFRFWIEQKKKETFIKINS